MARQTTDQTGAGARWRPSGGGRQWLARLQVGRHCFRGEWLAEVITLQEVVAGLRESRCLLRGIHPLDDQDLSSGLRVRPQTVQQDRKQMIALASSMKAR